VTRDYLDPLDRLCDFLVVEAFVFDDVEDLGGADLEDLEHDRPVEPQQLVVEDHEDEALLGLREVDFEVVLLEVRVAHHRDHGVPLLEPADELAHDRARVCALLEEAALFGRAAEDVQEGAGESEVGSAVLHAGLRVDLAAPEADVAEEGLELLGHPGLVEEVVGEVWSDVGEDVLEVEDELEQHVSARVRGELEVEVAVEAVEGVEEVAGDREPAEGEVCLEEVEAQQVELEPDVSLHTGLPYDVLEARLRGVARRMLVVGSLHAPKDVTDDLFAEDQQR